MTAITSRVSSIELDRLAAIVLFVPFLIVGLLLGGLKTTLVTFHHTDEALYHLPVILHFAEQLPWLDLTDYASATTPLFHMLLAVIGKATGFELPILRGINVAVSYCAAFAYYKLLTHQLGFRTGVGVVLAGLFLLSPYFFGASFLLLTDNLAWLFALLAVRYMLIATKSGKQRQWVMVGLMATLAILSRQTFIWVLMAGGVLIWARDDSWREKMWPSGVLFLSAIPTVALFFVWGGLTTPTFQAMHEARALLNLRSLQFALAVLGIYWLMLAPLSAAQALRSPYQLGMGIGVGALWLLLAPMSFKATDDGMIWRLSYAMPSVMGNSLVFWILVPLGCAALVVLGSGVVRNGRNALTLSPGFVFLTMFLLSVLPFNTLYQKYYDPAIAVFLAMMREANAPIVKYEAVAWSVLGVSFIAYALRPYMA